MFLTDFGFIRIQKRSYAEESRRVGYFRTWLTVGPDKRNYFLHFCRYVRRVVVASWNDYAAAGYPKNTFLYAKDVAGAVSGIRVFVVVIELCSSYSISLVNAQFLVGDDSLLIGQFPDSLRKRGPCWCRRGSFYCLLFIIVF